MTVGHARPATPRRYTGHGIEGAVWGMGFLMADVESVRRSARAQGWGYEPLSSYQHTLLGGLIDDARSDPGSAGAIMTRRAYADDWLLEPRSRRADHEVRHDPGYYPFLDLLEAATDKLRAGAPLTRVEHRGIAELVHSTLAFKPRPTKFDDEAY